MIICLRIRYRTTWLSSILDGELVTIISGFSVHRAYSKNCKPISWALLLKALSDQLFVRLVYQFLQPLGSINIFLDKMLKILFPYSSQMGILFISHHIIIIFTFQDLLILCFYILESPKIDISSCIMQLQLFINSNCFVIQLNHLRPLANNFWRLFSS